MENETYIGCKDNQTEEQKAKNFKFFEVCSSPAPVNWVEKKDKKDWKKIPERNQDGSLTCVAQTNASEVGIIFQQKYGEWVDFSAAFPYQKRGHLEWGGCTSEDIYTIFPKLGNLFEQYMPSQNIDENSIMKVERKKYYEDLAKLYNIKRISLPLDFETIASTIQATGKGVMAWFWFTSSEWSKEIPTINNPSLSFNNASHHSIVFIDYGLVNGKKYLKINDSAHFGAIYERWISEEFFQARCYLASYLMNFETLDPKTAERPVYDGKTIVSFQKCMKWEGLFPSNLGEVENYGPITRKACKDFQLKYGLVADGILGPITKAKVLSIYQ